MAKNLSGVCSLSKLFLLKYAKQKNMNCHPRVKGRIIESKHLPADASPRDRAFAPMVLTNEQVFCCGKKLGRHRRRGGHRRVARWNPQRAYRAHASYHRPYPALAKCARKCKGTRPFKKCVKKCMR